MGHIIDAISGIRIDLGNTWARAFIQLNVGSVNGDWLRVLFNSSQVKLEVALGLREVDWLSVRADVSGFLSHHSCLLDTLDVDGLGVLDGDDVKEGENRKRDLH